MTVFVLEEVGSLFTGAVDSEVMGVYATHEEAIDQSHTSMPFHYDSDTDTWSTDISEVSGIGFRVTEHILVTD